MSRESLRSRLLACFVLLCLGVCVSGVILAVERGFHSDKAFAQDLIRLHVIANSNLPQDQDLKLKVRDAVLLETKRILGDIAGKEQAYALLQYHAQTLERCAQETVWAHGFDYPVQVKLGNYLFPERAYGEWVLPEGSYDAVRVEIGAARGDNWWCILFPPLCLAELEGASSALVKVQEKTTDQKGTRSIVLRSRLWEQVAESRYARLFQNWWQASAAGLSVLAH
ncbi:MAG TPA: stage II sporulation protein R [Limnochordia bacterium]|nr:stage II sporulation protein R [Limnochordia bacterium]